MKHLVDSWQADDGRTLFLVGDAGSHCAASATQGWIVYQCANSSHGSRSMQPLIIDQHLIQQQLPDWVNQNFATAFPQIANINRGAVPYNYSTAVKEAIDNTPVSFNGFDCRSAK